jgi:hypothetical protein
VNRDVVFDEMVNWYSPMKITKDGEAGNVMFHQMWKNNHN